MTREERALAHLRCHVPDAARLLQIGSPGGECWVLDFALAFADAEAAAMRERAASVCDDLASSAAAVQAAFELAGSEAPAKAIQRECAETLAAAIRALPATGEVERG